MDGDASGLSAEIELLVGQTGELRDWSISVDGSHLDEMTAEDARRLAASLLDAAATLEAKAGAQR
jgi:hypothetical protein